MKRFLLAAVLSLLTIIPARAEDPVVVESLVKVVRAKLLALPNGTLAGIYLVRQLEGRQGTIVQVWSEDLQRWLDVVGKRAVQQLAARATPEQLAAIAATASASATTSTTEEAPAP